MHKLSLGLLVLSSSFISASDFDAPFDDFARIVEQMASFEAAQQARRAAIKAEHEKLCAQELTLIRLQGVEKSLAAIWGEVYANRTLSVPQEGGVPSVHTQVTPRIEIKPADQASLMKPQAPSVTPEIVDVHLTRELMSQVARSTTWWRGRGLDYWLAQIQQPGTKADLWFSEDQKDVSRRGSFELKRNGGDLLIKSNMDVDLGARVSIKGPFSIRIQEENKDDFLSCRSTVTGKVNFNRKCSGTLPFELAVRMFKEKR